MAITPKTIVEQAKAMYGVKAPNKVTDAIKKIVTPGQVVVNKPVAPVNPAMTNNAMGRIYNEQGQLIPQAGGNTATSNIGVNQTSTTGAGGASTVGQTNTTSTVATPSMPFIEKSATTSAGYDPANPEEYLMRMTAKLQTTGNKPNETEYYNMLQAQKALALKKAEEAKANMVNPREEQLKQQQADIEIAKAQEQGADTSALEAYKKQLEIDYANKMAEAQRQGEQQKTAAQNVYSFSGFGRSTKAADTALDIEKSTQSALNALNAQKELDIQLKQAELAGADPESLSAMRTQLDNLRNNSNDRLKSSMEKTQTANQESATDYMTAINNLMTTAGKAGVDLGSAKDVQAYAEMARNADGSVNEDFINSLPAELQSIIRSAAMTSKASTTTAPKVENFGTAKSPRYMQRDGTKRVSVSGAGGTGGGGGGGYSGGAGGVGLGEAIPTLKKGSDAEDLVNRLNKLKEAITNNPITTRLGLVSGLGDLAGDYEYIKNNLMFKEFAEAKKSGVTFGAASNKEREQLKKAASSIDWKLSNKGFESEANRLITGLGGVPSIPSSQTYSTTTAPTNTTTSSGGVSRRPKK